MTECQEYFTYPSNQERRMRWLLGCVSFVLLLGFISNGFTFVFILSKDRLRKKNLANIKLFIFNTADCIFWFFMGQVSINLEKVKENLRHSTFRLSFFFLYGQLIAISFIMFERIRMASVSGISLNSLSRDPSEGTYHQRLMTSFGVAVAVDILLTTFISQHQIIVTAVLAVFNIALYIILFIKVSKLQTVVTRGVVNARRKALLYASMLMVGFILEVLLITLYMMFTEEERLSNCQFVLDIKTWITSFCYAFRFIWDPASYFLFNAIPRKLLTKFSASCVSKTRSNQAVNHAVEAQS